jgi:hypothetical protein
MNRCEDPTCNNLHPCRIGKRLATKAVMENNKLLSASCDEEKQPFLLRQQPDEYCGLCWAIHPIAPASPNHALSATTTMHLSLQHCLTILLLVT